MSARQSLLDSPPCSQQETSLNRAKRKFTEDESRAERERKSLISSIEALEEPRRPLTLSLDPPKPTQFNTPNTIHYPRHAFSASSPLNFDDDFESVEVPIPTPPESNHAPSLGNTAEESPSIDFEGISFLSKRYLHHISEVASLTAQGPKMLKRKRETAGEVQERKKKLAGAVTTILECLGEDPMREGLIKTPNRHAEALLFLTKGYTEDLEGIVNDAVFHGDHDELVVVKDIEFSSLCEHHLVPFTGQVWLHG